MRLRERVFVVEQACVYLDADGVDPVSRHVWAERAGEIVAYLRIVPAGVKFDEIGPHSIRIGAQAHLERFYGELGFQRVSEPYDEDGIPHIEMLRAASP